MDLTELNEYADQLLETLKGTESAAEVRDIVFRLDGLHSGAHIKAAAASRCGNQAPTVEGIWCALPSGHDGFHSDGTTFNPVTWGIQCGVRWSWQGANGKHFEICTQPAEHQGLHYNRATDTTIAGNEPTKPIADRLHELVSYCRTEEESAIATADQHREDSGLTARKYPEDHEAGVYRELADKLEALLMEGGI